MGKQKTQENQASKVADAIEVLTSDAAPEPIRLAVRAMSAPVPEPPDPDAIRASLEGLPEAAVEAAVTAALAAARSATEAGAIDAAIRAGADIADLIAAIPIPGTSARLGAVGFRLVIGESPSVRAVNVYQPPEPKSEPSKAQHAARRVKRSGHAQLLTERGVMTAAWASLHRCRLFASGEVDSMTAAGEMLFEAFNERFNLSARTPGHFNQASIRFEERPAGIVAREEIVSTAHPRVRPYIERAISGESIEDLVTEIVAAWFPETSDGGSH